MKLFNYLFPLLVSFASQGQYAGETSTLKNDPLVDIDVRKSGPYIGLQQGKYLVLELGGEMIWKKIRLRKPITHAVHAGFNYNFKYKVLGLDGGYWIRPHRFGLTYGANLFYRTDFDQNKLGIAPVLGYKLWFAHLQVGYHFMPSPQDFQTNTIFISARLGLINDRDIDIDFRKRNKNNRTKK